MAMRLRWDGGYRFRGTDPHGAEVAMDGEHLEGAGIAELLPLSLAACLAHDVVTVMRKQRQDLTGLVAEIDGEQAEDAPSRFLRISVTFALSGRDLREHAIQRALRAARAECSVLHSLDPAIEVRIAHRVDPT